VGIRPVCAVASHQGSGANRPGVLSSGRRLPGKILRLSACAAMGINVHSVGINSSRTLFAAAVSRKTRILSGSSKSAPAGRERPERLVVGRTQRSGNTRFRGRLSHCDRGRSLTVCRPGVAGHMSAPGFRSPFFGSNHAAALCLSKSISRSQVMIWFQLGTVGDASSFPYRPPHQM
jgi:hypothetical protein